MVSSNNNNNHDQDLKNSPRNNLHDGNRVNDRKNNYNNVLDTVNRQIIRSLVLNPTISQVILAEQLGLSQSSVAVRLQKLNQLGLVKNATGVAYYKLGLQMGRADVYTTDSEPLLKWAESCPLLMLASVSIGNENISLFFVTEDLETTHWIIDSHLRKIKGVTNVTFRPIVSWVKNDGGGLVLPIDLTIQRSDQPPCGSIPYCPRCPVNPGYDGVVWNNEKKNNNGGGRSSGNNASGYTVK